MAAEEDKVPAYGVSDRVAARIRSVWEAIRQKTLRQGDSAPFTIRPPLSHADIEKLETQLAGTLPAEIKLSLSIAGGLDWKPGKISNHYFPPLQPGDVETVTGGDLIRSFPQANLNLEESARYVVFKQYTRPGWKTLFLGNLASGDLLFVTFFGVIGERPCTEVEVADSFGWPTALGVFAVMD